MAHGIAALSSERHYMGSFTSGAYATNRDQNRKWRFAAESILKYCNT